MPNIGSFVIGEPCTNLYYDLLNVGSCLSAQVSKSLRDSVKVFYLNKSIWKILFLFGILHAAGNSICIVMF